MHSRTIALIALATLLCSSMALAAPTKLSQQGRLLDGDGAPLSGGHGLEFTLHDAETDGNEVWREERVVQFEEGYYSIVLGTVTPLDDLLFAGGTVWMQLAVDGVVLSPRQEVVSVPYALRSAVAAAVEGGTVDADEVAIGGSVVIDSSGNWVGTAPDWNDLTGVPSDLSDGDGDTLLGLPCIDGQVPSYDSASALWICAAPSGMDTLSLLSCVGGEIVTWDDSNSQWVCATDSDTQLSEAEVDALVSNNNYSTGAHTIDTLVALPCADGLIAKYSATLGAWDCAQDDDSFAALACLSGEIPVYEALTGLWVCGVDLDTDTQLSEAQVDAFVANNGYSIGAHTTDTDTQLSEAQVDAFVANNGYSIGAHTTDTDTQLTEAQVDDFVANNNYSIGAHTIDTDTLASLNCPDGAAALWNATTSQWVCVVLNQFVDSDGDGITDSVDCSPGDATISHLANETCDGIDNDCDGLIDGADPEVTGGITYYGDSDGDGFGNVILSQVACAQPSGYVTTSNDCDDTNSNVLPGGTEVCDGVDNDCNGSADFTSSADDGGSETDSDSDGSIDCADCADNNSAVFPGAAESCNSADDDCDGTTDEGFDADADGVTTCGADGTNGTNDDDCDDTNSSSYPGNPEVCDGNDNDCDGSEERNGSGQLCAGNSCNDILSIAPGTTDGAYWLDPLSTGAFQAYCDMTTVGGGWTLVGKLDGLSSTGNGVGTTFWRNPNPQGDISHLVSDNVLGASFQTLAFSDVLVRSLATPARHIAWSHPSTYGSVYQVVDAGVRINDGVLLSGSVQNLDYTGSPSTHNGCADLEFGFFGYDVNITNNGNFVGHNMFTGHAGGVVAASTFATGGGAGCVTDWGFGANSYSATNNIIGHNWAVAWLHDFNPHGFFVR